MNSETISEVPQGHQNSANKTFSKQSHKFKLFVDASHGVQAHRNGQTSARMTLRKRATCVFVQTENEYSELTQK